MMGYELRRRVVDALPGSAFALCCLALLVGSILFRSSLTNVNADANALDGFAFQASYVPEKLTKTYGEDEIRSAWRERYSEDAMLSTATIPQMSARLGMQPRDPGLLADLVVVGRVTQNRVYRYGTFVTNVVVERIIVPLSETSKATSRGETYALPKLDLTEGDVICVYDEFAIQPASSSAADGGSVREVCPSSGRSLYANFFTPLRSGETYLFFLNCTSNADISGVEDARFGIVTSLYGRIPIQDGDVSRPRVFCANLPTEEGAVENTPVPFGTTSAQNDEQKDNQPLVEALKALPDVTFAAACKVDLYVESPDAEKSYRGMCSEIVSEYL